MFEAEVGSPVFLQSVHTDFSRIRIDIRVENFGHEMSFRGQRRVLFGYGQFNFEYSTLEWRII